MPSERVGGATGDGACGAAAPHLVHSDDPSDAVVVQLPFKAEVSQSVHGLGTSAKTSVAALTREKRSSGQLMTNTVPTTLSFDTNGPPADSVL